MLTGADLISQFTWLDERENLPLLCGLSRVFSVSAAVKEVEIFLSGSDMKLEAPGEPGEEWLGQSHHVLPF